jgi:hypothetical protein
MPNDNGIAPLIPNAFKRLHPLDHAQAVIKPDTRPPEVTLHTTIKYILRNGEQGKSLGRRMWWGDRPHEDGAIVAYRVIKLKTAWVEWGDKFDRGEGLETGYGGVPLALAEANPPVKVWLRDCPTPQGEARRAHSWDWHVSGEGEGDIMKYRIISN